MPVADQRHVTGGQERHGAVDDLATLCGHFFDALAGCRSGNDAVVENCPRVTNPLANLGGGQSLVVVTLAG